MKISIVSFILIGSLSLGSASLWSTWKNLFGLEKTEIDAVTTERPGDVYKDCGGDIQLEYGQDVYIEYKLNENHAPLERCFWFLHADNTHLYTVKATLLAHSFNRDGVALYSADETRNELSSYYLELNDVYEILLHPFTFFSYQSDDDDDYLGKGFQVLLQLGIRENVSTPYENFSVRHVDTWNDFIRHPEKESNYKIDERSYFVINPPNPRGAKFRLHLDFMDIEACSDLCTCDSLDIYQIYGINNYKRTNRICGQGPNSLHEILCTNAEPLVLVFHSDNATTAHWAIFKKRDTKSFENLN